MQNAVIKYGLISGALVSMMMLLTLPFHDQIGFGIAGLLLGYTTMVLAFLLIYFGVRAYRDTVLGGKIGFGRAFGAGLLIAAIASACYVATWEVVYFNYMPDFMDKYSAQTLQQARADGASEAELAARKAEMDEIAVKYKNPLYNAAYTFMEPLPVGLIIALVSAVALSRRKKRDAEDNAIAGAAGLRA